MKAAIFLVIGLALSQFSMLQMRAMGRPLQVKEPLVYPPEYIEHFTFGYGDIIADVLWLRSIQDFDFCGETATKKVVSEDGKEIKVCAKGWIFQMLDAATRIARRYYIIYFRGAVSLSVIVNEKEGAAILFERGVSVFPKDWSIPYAAGYHELVERKNYQKAGEYFTLAGKNGAPNWVTLLAAKVFSEAGQAEIGIRALEEFYHESAFEDWPVRAQERYRELKGQLAKSRQNPEKK